MAVRKKTYFFTLGGDGVLVAPWYKNYLWGHEVTMIVDLKGMDTTVLPNFKGGEKEFKAKMYFDGTTRIMRGTLEQGPPL